MTMITTEKRVILSEAKDLLLYAVQKSRSFVAVLLRMTPREESIR